jgi:hypothetical protein
MPSPASAQAVTLRRLAAVVVGMTLALLAAEAAFRVAGLGATPIVKRRLRRDDYAPGELVYHCYPSNPHGEFVQAPDVSVGRWTLTQLSVPTWPVPLADLPQTPWCVEYRRDSPDVRGPAVTETPRPGVSRIAGIGDSFAMGEGVPYEKTLFVRLDQLLGGGYETLNCAVGGFDTNGELLEMEFVVPHYHCTRALLVYDLNDVEIPAATRARMESTYDLVNLRALQSGADSRPWYRHAFHVAEFVASSQEVREIARETVASYLDAYDPTKNGANLEVLAGQFRRLAAWPGCRVGVVVYPMMYRLESAYPLQPCHDEVVRLARAAGLPVLDLAPFFAGQDTASLQVHPIDHHPNGRAHEIAARAIAPWILAEPSLR